MLDTFITSRVRRKIVVVYAKYPDFKTHVRGLAKLIKEDAGNIQRELKRLEKIGFLISEKQGNTKIYHTNKHFPIFKELQSIVLKSQRINQNAKIIAEPVVCPVYPMQKIFIHTQVEKLYQCEALLFKCFAFCCTISKLGC